MFVVCTFHINFKKVFHLLHQAYTHSLSFFSVDPTTMGPPLYEGERTCYSFVEVVFVTVDFGFVKFVFCEVRRCGFCEGCI